MNVTTDDIEVIESEMNSLVNQNVPLMRVNLSYWDVMDEMKKNNHPRACELLKTLNNPFESLIEMKSKEYTYRLLWRNPVFSHTGVCKGLFKLVPYNNGFIVRYSEDFKTLDMSPIRNSERL